MHESSTILLLMRHLTLALTVSSLLLLAACGGGKTGPSAQTPTKTKPDTITITNTGKTAVQKVSVSTSQGKTLWQGDLAASSNVEVKFVPTENGHFVIDYGTPAGEQEYHKGYFTQRGGLLHTLSISSDGNVSHKASRAQ